MKTSTLFLSFLIVLTSLQAQEITSNVYFDSDQYELKKEAVSTLNELLKRVEKENDYQFQIFGHTDSRGSIEYNQTLSDNRAKAVMSYLLYMGIDRNSVSIQRGFSELKPIDSNENEMGRQQNRRVEIRLSIPIAQEEQLVVKTKATPVHIKKIEEEIEEEIVFVDVPTFFENDSLIIAEMGTEVEIPAGTFHPYKIKDLTIIVTEVLTHSQMLEYGTITVDYRGNCLASDGMVFVDVRNQKGKKVRPKKDITIRIPSEEIDEEMMFYKQRKSGSRILWQRTKIKPTAIRKMNRNYYQFATRSIAGCNMDKPIGKIAGFFGKKPKPNPYFKTKKFRLDKPSSKGKSKMPLKAYVSNESTVIGAQYYKKNKFYFGPSACPCIAEDAQILTAIGFDKNNQLHYINKPMSELRLKGFWRWKRYVLKKKDFKKVNSKDELEEALNESLAALSTPKTEELLTKK